jgi:HAD superfamily hydrolase (TIGR01509 family)
MNERVQSDRVVLWDLGGVVVDVEVDRGRRKWVELGGREDAFEDAFFRSGVKDRLDDGRMSLEDGLSEVVRHAGGSITPDIARRSFEAILSVRPHMTHLIQRVAARARCVVISNTDPIHGPWIERNAGIYDVIESWVYSYEERAMKPEPELFNAALRRAGVEAPQAILVDDRADNVATARGLGLDTIHFTAFRDVVTALEQRGLA